MQRIFHFSGGHSSALMVIENYKPGDLVIFCDTGREHEDTYRFVNDFEKNTGIPVIQLTYPGGWAAMLKRERLIPNMHKRKCTIEMKIRRARRYLRSIGLNRYVQFIGFRFDEPKRVKEYFNRWKFVETRFPLNDAKIDKICVNSFFAGMPWRLTIPSILGNCDLCFMKGKDAAIAILMVEPWRADKWIADEENDPNGYTYHSGVTIRQLLAMAQSAVMSGKGFDLHQLQPAFNCACSA